MTGFAVFSKQEEPRSRTPQGPPDRQTPVHSLLWPISGSICNNCTLLATWGTFKVEQKGKPNGLFVPSSLLMSKREKGRDKVDRRLHVPGMVLFGAGRQNFPISFPKSLGVTLLGSRHLKSGKGRQGWVKELSGLSLALQ